MQRFQASSAWLFTWHALAIVSFNSIRESVFYTRIFLTHFVFISSRYETGNVDLKTLYSALNWRESPIPHPKAAEEAKVEDNKLIESSSLLRQQMRINYPALLQDLEGIH